MSDPILPRRNLVLGAAASVIAGLSGANVGSAATPASPASAPTARFRHSASLWNLAPVTLEQLCAECVRLGVPSVELVGPDTFPTLKRHGLTCAIFGRHGFAKGFAHVEEHGECVAACTQALDEAAAFGSPNVITFSGFSRGIPKETGFRNMVDGLKKVAAHAEKRRVTLCLEMLNSRVDVPMKGHPDYFCDDIDQAVDIVKAVSSERVKVLFDIYHVQIMNGDVIRRIRQHAAWIGHVHTAGNPGRCDLDVPDQELNYPAILRALAETGYPGFVGQEFIPRAGTVEGNLAALDRAIRLCRA
jgi:hydroxypyruvate isomerase